MNDGIGDASLIFDAEKYEPLGSAGALARNNASADAQALSAAKEFEFGCRADAECFHFGAMVSHGMRSDGETSAVEVGDEALRRVNVTGTSSNGAR